MDNPEVPAGDQCAQCGGALTPPDGDPGDEWTEAGFCGPACAVLYYARVALTNRGIDKSAHRLIGRAVARLRPPAEPEPVTVQLTLTAVQLDDSVLMTATDLRDCVLHFVRASIEAHLPTTGPVALEFKSVD